MSRPVVAVRIAQSGDLDSLVRLWTELREISRDGATARVGRPSTWTPESARCRLTEMLQSDASRIVVAEADGAVIGMAVLCQAWVGQLLDMPAVQLTHVVVDDAFRRRGVGRQLIASAVTWAEEIGAEEIVVSVYPGLREANRFYARLGFAPLVVRRVAPVSALRRKLAVNDNRGAIPLAAIRRRRAPTRSAISLRARITHADEAAAESM